MKRIAVFFFVLIGLLTAGLGLVRAQQTADSQYLNIYSVIQEGDVLAGSGNLRLALDKYSEAQTQLQQFRNAFPDWNSKIVTFRLKYLGEKITDFKSKLPAPPPVAPPVKAPPVILTTPADTELAALRGQLESAQAEKEILLAKLKEALGAQPALAESGELEKLQSQIKALLKENALLKASLAPTNIAAADTKNSASNAPAAEPLELKQARQQIASLKSAAQVSQLEKVALENRIQQLQTNVPSESATAELAASAARVRELTQERDNLLAKLGTVNQQLYGSKKPDAVAQVDQLTDQIRTLRERLAVAEAQPVPYTAEELALLKQSAPTPVAIGMQKKSLRQLPPGSAALVAEAQTLFAAQQYDQAEAKYLKVLQYDPNNPLVLGNLAAIEMQEGKLAESETHIKAALAQDPNDAFNLATLGYLRFRQEKFDEALDILSRATKLDPGNPEILNYLGVTLSQKGQRPQAEAALRKAIELKPDYAAAHNNLAAIYISQLPPLVELARWHYQKALDAGQPRNPAMEKALEATNPTPATP